MHLSGASDAQNTNLVPFALRWLAAELPHRLGNTSAAQDALYRLTQLCETEALHAQEREGSSEGRHAGILGQDMSEVMPGFGLSCLASNSCPVLTYLYAKP